MRSCRAEKQKDSARSAMNARRCHWAVASVCSLQNMLMLTVKSSAIWVHSSSACMHLSCMSGTMKQLSESASCWATGEMLTARHSGTSYAVLCNSRLTQSKGHTLPR